ncbi:MAG: lysylphosphatidylglycerol synthase transmembrane domain-containing protein [Bacteriovoracaceae bacterium]
MLKQVLKCTFAGALLYWLFSQGKLDFSLIGHSLNHHLEWTLCIGFLISSVMITTYRWKSILETKSSVPFQFFSILKLTWIGLMFNTVLPGAVTGDLIKLVYARNIDKSLDKTFLITSVVMDRILGLFGLLTLLGISSLFNYNELTSNYPDLVKVIHFNFLLTFGMIVFLVILFLPHSMQEKIKKLVQMLPLVKHHAVKTLDQVWLIGKNRKMIIVAILLSVACHIFNIMAFWTLVKPFFTHDIPTRYAFSFIPIGFLTVALPISPAGLGVGHAMFDKLFSYFGIMNGASLFNFYFISNVIINLFGLIPYLAHKDKRPLTLEN